MDKIVKVEMEDASKQLIKNADVKITLEGWPCAVAVIGLGIAYVVITKIKQDTLRMQYDNNRILDKVAWHLYMRPSCD